MKTLCNFAICVMVVVTISSLAGCGNSQATTDELVTLQQENSELKSDNQGLAEERDKLSKELAKYHEAEAAEEKAATDAAFQALLKVDLSLIGLDSSSVNVGTVADINVIKASLTSMKGMAVRLFGYDATESIRGVLANPNILKVFYATNKSGFKSLLQETKNIGHSTALVDLLLGGMQDHKKCRKVFQAYTDATDASNTVFEVYQDGVPTASPQWKIVLDRTGLSHGAAMEQYYAFLFYTRRLNEGGQPLVDAYVAILKDMSKDLGS